MGSVVGDGNGSSSALQQFGGDLLVHLIVFGEQHPDARSVVSLCLGFRSALLLRVGRGHAKQIDQGVIQQRRVQRLEQISINADLFGLCTDIFTAECGDHHDLGDVLQPIIVSDDAAGFEAVDAGHVPVHQYQFVGILGVSSGDFADSVFARGNGISSQGKDAQCIGKDFAGLGVVVHYQSADAGKVRNELFAFRA